MIPPSSVEPYAVPEGLATYRFGANDPVLFMPYPHGASVERKEEVWMSKEQETESALGGRDRSALLTAHSRQMVVFDSRGGER